MSSAISASGGLEVQKVKAKKRLTGRYSNDINSLQGILLDYFESKHIYENYESVTSNSHVVKISRKLLLGQKRPDQYHILLYIPTTWASVQLSMQHRAAWQKSGQVASVIDSLARQAVEFQNAYKLQDKTFNGKHWDC